MNEEILTAVRLPARLDSQQCSKLLGFAEHDLTILNRVGLLKPLGRPSVWSQKWYSSAAILELARDEKWLDKATAAVNGKWRAKNKAAKAKRRDRDPSKKISVLEASGPDAA